MKYFIGIDLGGTNIKAGIVTEKGKITKLVKKKTEASKGKNIVLRNAFRCNLFQMSNILFLQVTDRIDCFTTLFTDFLFDKLSISLENYSFRDSKE